MEQILYYIVGMVAGIASIKWIWHNIPPWAEGQYLNNLWGGFLMLTATASVALTITSFELVINTL